MILRWIPRVVVAVVVAALVLASGRYGYHRDELYFIVAGNHPAWGYPDQPPLIPLLARLMDGLAPGSLVALRLPAALAAGGVVAMTGVLTRQLGGKEKAQAIATATMGVSAIVLGAGHLAGTTIFDLLVWTVVTWLAVAIVRDGRERLWPVAGLVIGLGLQVKTLLAFYVVALVVGLLATGRGRVLLNRWCALAAVIAAALWAPNLIWQAQHGWPQMEMAGAIGDQGLGGRIDFVVFQLIIVSPLLLPIWVAGLRRLVAEPSLRFLAIAYGLLAVVFLVTGGKGYYLAGLYPVLVAAGSLAVAGWVERGSHARRRLLAGGLVGSTVVSAVLTLPIVPVSSLGSTPIVAMNYDAGETVGWPRFVATVGDVWATLPAEERERAAVLTANYGQAGAMRAGLDCARAADAVG